jgi:hypothetical protein
MYSDGLLAPTKAFISAAEKLVPYRAKARQYFHFEKESVLAVSAGADPIKAERISATRVRDTLAKEDRLVP